MIKIVKLLKNNRNWQIFILSTILICAIFPDVIFFGTSLRLTDQIYGDFYGLATHHLYAIPAHSEWWGWYNDSGGAVFQSEPMINFIHNCIKNWQSPFWNPYSGAGALGPETLVDEKFSFFIMLNAILGGGSLAYNITLILLWFFAVFFLMKISVEQLNFSLIAATTMSIFYILNGYSISNMGSNITYSYVYIPICLYVSFRLANKITIMRIVAVILSYAIFFTCTFIPTTIMSFVTMFFLFVSYSWYRSRHINCINRKQFLILILYFIFAIYK